MNSVVSMIQEGRQQEASRAVIRIVNVGGLPVATWKASTAALIVIVTSLFFYWNTHNWSNQVTRKSGELIASPDPNYKTYMQCSINSVLCGVQSDESIRDVVSSMRVDLLKMVFHRLVTSVDTGAKLCPNIARYGQPSDGGYDICLTPPFKPEPGNCLVYSFGINGDWSFDESIANHTCEVHSFDPSIGLQDHLHAPRIHFHNLGLWGQDKIDGHKWQLMSLSSIRRRLGHEQRPIDILKVDVEVAEWPFMRDVTIRDPDQLSDVRQLMIELHTPRSKSTPMNETDVVEAIDYVNRLLTTGVVCARTGARLLAVGFQPNLASVISRRRATCNSRCLGAVKC